MVSPRSCLWAALLVALASAAAAERRPVISVETSVHPGDAYLHQQAVLEVVVEHHLFAQPRWEPPVCEGFWVERMPSEGSELNETDGNSWRTTTFRRALFPTRLGSLAIPGSVLRVRGEDGSDIEIAAPGTSLRVVALPEAGRPADFSGLVGSLQVRLDLDDDQLASGRSVGVTIDVFGDANVWDVPIPRLEALIAQRVEVFAVRPRVITHERDGRLVARRRFRFDVVPQTTGTYRIEPFRIAYFDPHERRYAEVSSDLAELNVVARGAAPQRPPWQAEPEARVGLNPGLMMPLALTFLLALILTAMALKRWWQREQSARRGDPAPRPEVQFERAAAALGSDAFFGLLGAAVREQIALRHALDPSALTTHDISQCIDDPDALRILRAVDSARFERGRSDQPELLELTRRYLEN